jgi:hypothetical protein
VSQCRRVLPNELRAGTLSITASSPGGMHSRDYLAPILPVPTPRLDAAGASSVRTPIHKRRHGNCSSLPSIRNRDLGQLPTPRSEAEAARFLLLPHRERHIPKKGFRRSIIPLPTVAFSYLATSYSLERCTWLISCEAKRKLMLGSLHPSGAF